MREVFLLIFGSLLYVSGHVANPNVASTCLKYVSVVKEHENILWNGDLQTYEKVSKSICEVFENECEHFQKHLPYVIAMISEMQPIDVCRLITPTEGAIPINTKETKSSFLCIACKSIVNFIRFQINVLKKTSAQVKDAIKYLCKVLSPLKIQVEVCDDIMNYIDNVIQWILNGTTPGDVCIKLKLCTNGTESYGEKQRMNHPCQNRGLRCLLLSIASKAHPFTQKHRSFRPRHHPFWPRHHKFRPRHHKFRPHFWPKRHRFGPHKRGCHFRRQRHRHQRHRHHHKGHHRHHHGNHTHHHGNHSHHHGNHTHHHGNHSHHHGNHTHHHGNHTHHHKHRPHHHGHHHRHHSHHHRHHHGHHHPHHHGNHTDLLKNYTHQEQPEEENKRGFFEQKDDNDQTQEEKNDGDVETNEYDGDDTQYDGEYTEAGEDDRYDAQPTDGDDAQHTDGDDAQPTDDEDDAQPTDDGDDAQSTDDGDDIEGDEDNNENGGHVTDEYEEENSDDGDYTDNEDDVTGGDSQSPEIDRYDASDNGEHTEGYGDYTEHEGEDTDDYDYEEKNTETEKSVDWLDPSYPSNPDQPTWNEEPESDYANLERLPAYDEEDRGLLGGDYMKFNIPTLSPPSETDDGDNLREEVGKSILEGFLGDGFFKSGMNIWKTMDKLNKLQIPDMPKITDILMSDNFDNLREEVGGDIFKKFLKHPILKAFPKKIKKTMVKIKKNMEKIGKELKENMTKTFGNLTTGHMKNSFGCAICTTIVKIITWEVKTVNATIETIEKLVKAMCAFYPIQVAEEVCKEIVDKVDEIIQLVEEGVEPGQICERLKLCNATQPESPIPSLFMMISPTMNNSRLCALMKTLYESNVKETTKLWIKAKEKLYDFCEKNSVEGKCDRLFRIFEKAERQLSSVITHENSDTQDCFKNQVVPKNRLNKCAVCRYFEKGLVSDLKEANATMKLLATTLEEMCTMLETSMPECQKIVEDFRSAFEQFEGKLKPTGMCKAFGFCDETSMGKKSAKKMIEKSIESIFPGGNPFMVRGMPMTWRKKLPTWRRKKLSTWQHKTGDWKSLLG